MLRILTLILALGLSTAHAATPHVSNCIGHMAQLAAEGQVLTAPVNATVNIDTKEITFSVHGYSFTGTYADAPGNFSAHAELARQGQLVAFLLHRKPLQPGNPDHGYTFVLDVFGPVSSASCYLVYGQEETDIPQPLSHLFTF